MRPMLRTCSSSPSSPPPPSSPSPAPPSAAAGPSAAGWLAAIPTTLPIGILAVAAELGDQAGAAMALSAAAHVGAQVAFAVTLRAG